MDIVQSSAPAEFRRVAYFEGFNPTRPCLTMDISQLSFSSYTHVHMAFAGLSPDFQVDVSTIQAQFDKFNAMTGLPVKKILSIGGWAFSTDPGTYFVFRNMVQGQNQVTAATNIANFINSNNLDGVDIDWEYPGAPDIPG
jgi:GH18 family chitinase